MIDTSRPNIARVYDCFLGGKDHFTADLDEARRLIEVYPYLPGLARHNRMFLGRAITWIAQQGVRQFLDIGSGLPTASNTHQIAQAVDPACRVVYADNDRMVIAHALALLARAGVTAVLADLTNPAELLATAQVSELITPGEPTCLVLAMVLHFIDAETVSKVMAELTGWLAPGSYVVISVGSGDEETGGALVREYQAGTLYNHQPQEILSWLTGLDLLPPGLTDVRHWEADASPSKRRTHRGGHVLAAVARKPG